MSDDRISGNNFLRAAERVRAQRDAERTGKVEPKAEPLIPPRTTSSVRARLNFIPDEDTLQNIIGNALAALSRGVRWARGSILNLLV